MTSSNIFDVAIVGRGITGISAAHHLAPHGSRNICILGPTRRPESCTSLGPGFVVPGPIDNVTRVHHQYGSAITQGLLKAGMHGFENLKSTAKSFNLPWEESSLERWSLSDDETQEMRKAVELLVHLGQGAKLRTPTGRSNAVTASQEDGIPTAHTDISALLNYLEQNSAVNVIEGMGLWLIREDSHFRLKTSVGDIRAQMVVIAAHLETTRFLPELHDVLIPVADQWISFQADVSDEILPRGRFVVAKHGHYCLGKGWDHRVYMSGGRFLRTWAGIEGRDRGVHENITEHLIAQGKDWLGFTTVSDLRVAALLDCRPCDEFPLIGPMYGDNRILIASGYMGSGLALGFAAGEALADFITQGSCKFLHEYFEPRRLRSL